jgi:hypothetical protein
MRRLTGTPARMTAIMLGSALARVYTFTEIHLHKAMMTARVITVYVCMINMLAEYDVNGMYM